MKTRSTIADRYITKEQPCLFCQYPCCSLPRCSPDEKDLRNLSETPYALNSTANPYSKNNQHGDGIGNPSGQYGSLYGNKSATNPFTADAPKPYDQQGQYRDRLECESVCFATPPAIRMGVTAASMGMPKVTHLVVASRMVMAQRIRRALAARNGKFQSTILV